VMHMTIATVRRLAADIMDVGENKIKISPDGLKEAEGALTRSDVKGLIEKGIVKKMKMQGRASTRKVRRVGHGHRKGTPIDSKTLWMQKIRAQRNVYKMLIKDGLLKESKRAVYSKIKSGMLRSKRALLVYLKEASIIPKDYELPKVEYKKPVNIAPKSAKAAPVQKQSAGHTASEARKPENIHRSEGQKPEDKKKGEQK
jgi:large subunit ribosomal protein L19e